MQTALYSLSCSGNVLDLDAYRRRVEALRPAAPSEDAVCALWTEEDAPAAPSFGDASARRERPSVGAMLDMAASAAMIFSALAAAAMVLS